MRKPLTHPVPARGAAPPTRCTRLAQAALLLLAAPAHAQSATDAPPPSGEVQTVVIEASADASAKGLSKPYAGGQVARGSRIGMLGTQDFMETPFSATAYTGGFVQRQQAKGIGDVLLNDPAVRNARGFGNFQELYVLRGFPLYSDDIAYNGLYGLLPRQYVTAELIERVEVFRGASAFLNGAAPGGSGLGGSINLLPKRAADAPLTQVSLGAEGGEQVMAGLDLSRRFGPDRSTGLRVNAVRRQGETAIDGEKRELSALAVGVDWRGRGVRLSADLGHQDHQQDAPRPSVTPFAAIPAAPDAQKNFAQPWTASNERQTFGTLRAEFDVASGTTAWLAAGARSGTERNDLMQASMGADGSGSFYRFVNAREDRVATGEAGLRTAFATGPVGHELSVSASWFRISSRNAYAFSNFAGEPFDLYDPQAVAAPAADFFTGGTLDDPNVTQRKRQSSVAIADVLRLLGGRVVVLLGARRQTIDDRSYDYGTGAQLSAYDESATTPMAAVVWRATPQLSLYANTIQGLLPGEVAPAAVNGLPVTNGGEALNPYKTRQAEIGAKVDLGRFGGSLALFRIKKPVGAAVDNGNGTATFVLQDAQRHQGVELSVFGEPAAGFKLLGGASWIDAELLESGKQAIGVPRVQLNLGAEWSPSALPDLSFDARVLHTGRQWADAANTIEVPSWTRLDVGAAWAAELAGKPLTLRLRIDNVLGKDYWASAGGYPGANYLVLGAPRTVSFSASADF